MSVFEIPLSPNQQKFFITLSGITYQLVFKWNNDPYSGGWVLDIYDVNQNLILGGEPLVTGCDLLAQYAYLGIVGQLIVETDHDVDAVPTFDNLGVNSHLFYLISP